MMLKRCPVCDTEFESHKLSQKYCSEDCRLIRARETDKLRKQKERAAKKVIREKEKQRIKQAKAEALNKHIVDEENSNMSNLVSFAIASYENATNMYSGSVIANSITDEVQ